MAKRYEKLVEVRKITEYRDGCIYRTVSLGERWVSIDTEMYRVYKENGDDIQYVSLNSRRLRELNDKTMRTVTD